MSQPDLGIPSPEGIDKVFPVTISRASFGVIAEWSIAEDNWEKRIYTGFPLNDGGLSEAQYALRLSSRIAKKFFDVAVAGNIDADVVTFDFSYNEIDFMILRAALSHQDFTEAARELRGNISNATLSPDIVYMMDSLKGSLLEVLESFVAGGGQDIYGYREGLQKILNMRVGYSPPGIDGDGGDFYFIEDTEEISK